jgi:hypothetical protein
MAALMRRDMSKEKVRHDQQKETSETRLARFGDRDECVLTFAEWCALNSFSIATGRRIKNSGKGPQFVRLSARRIGVTVRVNREWQAARGE